MSFARDVYTATSGQTDFVISFPYLNESHVLVSQNGTLLTQTTDYTFPSAALIRLVSGATTGDTILLTRSSSQASRLTDWETGTTITEDDLDTDSLQAFYMAQEAVDAAATALGLDAADLWDAGGTRITEVGTPTAASDAATKEYADDLVAAEGNVPTAEGVGTLLTSEGTTFGWAALEATGAQIEDAAVNTEHFAAAAVDLAAIDASAGTEGYVLTNEEATSVVWAPRTGIQVYSASDTWTKPAGLKYIIAKVQTPGGGGGFGNSAAGETAIGSGGAGGGYCEVKILAASLGATETITINAAGVGGVGSTSTNATAGGNVTFGAHITATGGAAGTQSASATAAAVLAGTAQGNNTISTGTTILNIPGGGGQGGFRLDGEDACGGAGGNSFWGRGGENAASSAGASDTGNAGSGYGGGGSGGASRNNTDVNGGAGAPGRVVIEEHF